MLIEGTYSKGTATDLGDWQWTHWNQSGMRDSELKGKQPSMANNWNQMLMSSGCRGLRTLQHSERVGFE